MDNLNLSDNKLEPKTPSQVCFSTRRQSRNSINSQDSGSEEAEEEISSVLEGMSTLRIKRSESCMRRGSIEGSPIMFPRVQDLDDECERPDKKRLDTAMTPAAMSNTSSKLKLINTPQSELILRIRRPHGQVPAGSNPIISSTPIKKEDESNPTHDNYCRTPGSAASMKSMGATSLPLSLPESYCQDSVSPKPSPVLIISSTCAQEEHDTGKHQENALRTALLVGADGCLRREALKSSLVWAPTTEFAPAPIADLVRVHEWEYLQHILDKSKGTPPFTAPSSSVRNAGACGYPLGHAPNGVLDVDTPLGPTSLSSARRFCSAAMFAVDCILGDHLSIENTNERNKDTHSESDVGKEDARNGNIEKIRRAFVLGRPPGHHAGPSGCVIPETYWRRPEMSSNGFCLLNTAAIAAAYARYTYGRSAHFENLFDCPSIDLACESTTTGAAKPRIAIVDIDVHHGNGTEACVRNLSPSMQPLPLPSSWHPRYEASYKPWLDDDDAKETFFGSIQLFMGQEFYPGSGQDSISKYDDVTRTGINCCNIGLTSVGPGPCDAATRFKMSEKMKKNLCVQASDEMRTKVKNMLLPALRDFGPTLLILSSGFDAHYDDAYHYLTEEDYAWLTEQLCTVAVDECGAAGVVSILEGGYSLSSPIKASKGKKKSSQTSLPSQASPSPGPSNKYSQEPGDGGLVKSVLGHVAGLAGVPRWN